MGLVQLKYHLEIFESKVDVSSTLGFIYVPAVVLFSLILTNIEVIMNRQLGQCLYFTSEMTCEKQRKMLNRCSNYTICFSNV